MDDKIDKDMFRRLVIMTSSTLLQDLLYIEEHITNKCFKLSNISEEGLLTNGWIISYGVSMALDQPMGDTKCKYSEMSRIFSENVFCKSPDDEQDYGRCRVMKEMFSIKIIG